MIKEITSIMEFNPIALKMTIVLNKYVKHGRCNLSTPTLLDVIYRNIGKNPEFGLFIDTDEEGNINAFTMLEKLNTNPPHGVCNLMHSSIFLTKDSRRLWDEGFELFKNWAYEHGCDEGFVCSSHHNPKAFYEKVLRKKGFKPIAVDYHRPLELEEDKHAEQQ